jgi:hypothetical protein
MKFPIMKRSRAMSCGLLAVLIMVSITNTASAATWGVCEGDELKYQATMFTDNQFVVGLTVTMTVEFNVTFVDDYVTADMSEDGGAAVNVFFNTQSLDDDFGINIKSSNGINIRYIADEQRFQAQMSQISDEIGSVLGNFSMSRVDNHLIISAHGGGSAFSWTYEATIDYTSQYVLYGMSELHSTTDGVNDGIQTVDWTLVYHHTECTTSSATTGTTPATTPPTTPGPVTAPDIPIPMIVGASGVVIVIVALILIRRR